MASENLECGQTWTSSSDCVSITVTCPSTSEKAASCSFDLRAEFNNLQQQYLAATTHLDQLNLKVKQLQQNIIHIQDRNRTACQESPTVLYEIANAEKCNKELYKKSLCLKTNVNKYCQLEQHLKDKLECENVKINEPDMYICKCKEDYGKQLSEKQQLLDTKLKEKRQLQTSVYELKQRLKQQRNEHQDKREEYINVMEQIAEIECEWNTLNTRIDDFTEELSSLFEDFSYYKIELDKANEEHEWLHADHCLIKCDVFHQEDERLNKIEHIAEIECEQNRLNDLIDDRSEVLSDLSEKLPGLRSEIEKVNEEYQRLHAECGQIRDEMLHQEDERQKFLDFLFEQVNKVMTLEKEIEKSQKRKRSKTHKREKRVRWEK